MDEMSDDQTGLSVRKINASVLKHVTKITIESFKTCILV